MNLLIALLFIVTAYTPGINPKMNGDNFDAYGLPISKYTIACGSRYWAHVFVFEDEIPGSQIRVCSDSVLGGRAQGNLDLAIIEGGTKVAVNWGKRSTKVLVISPDDFLRSKGIVDIPLKNKDKILKILEVLE